jgi:hypothetical protein
MQKISKNMQPAQHRLQATRLTPLPAEEKRAQMGFLSKALRRTRRAPEPYRYAVQEMIKDEFNH